MTAQVSAREPLLQYPTVVISDPHFGKKGARADLLLEFLSNVQCSKLIINGDFFDGWLLDKKDKWKLPEIQMRVLDRINAMAQQGTEIIYLPGNHDEKLRGFWDNDEKKVKKKPADNREPLLNKTYSFNGPDGDVSIRLVDGLEYEDPTGRLHLLMHGDQFDPDSLKTKWGLALSKGTDHWYDAFIRFDKAAKKIGKLLGTNLMNEFSLASWAKHRAKGMFNIHSNIEKAILETTKDSKYQSLILGHTHEEKCSPKYKNSGDWMESNTALVHDEEGQWRLVHWEQERVALGFGELLTEKDVNPYAAYREVSEKQMRLMQRVWPGKDIKKALNKVNKARKKMLNDPSVVSAAAKFNQKYQKYLHLGANFLPYDKPEEKPAEYLPS